MLHSCKRRPAESKNNKKNTNSRNLSIPIYLLKVFSLTNFASSLVSLLALLLIVLGRMFLHYVYLEMIRSLALVVAFSTGKRLLPSVCPHVFS